MNILLDLDGTLTDSREGIFNCIRHAFEGLEHPCPDDVELRRFLGPPLSETFGAVFGMGSPRVTRAIELYRERFTVSGMFENAVYAGIPEALARLRERGARLMIATTKPTVYAERIVEHFGLGRDIEAVFGSELDGTRSDKRDLIAWILKTRALSALATRMVGDREHDMHGAAANGVFGIGVLWGFGSREELLDAGARALCDTPASLCAVAA